MRTVWVTSRRVDWNEHMWTTLFTVAVGGISRSVVWACVLSGRLFKMTERVEQRICIKFCVKLKHSSTETIQMIQKAASMGNWWLVPTHASRLMQSFGVKHQITQVTQPPIQPRLGFLQFLVLPKTKITFEREGISEYRWDSGKYHGVADGNWENCVRSQGAYFEGDWGVIVLCTMLLILVFSSINTSIFHHTWLDTFRTDLIYFHFVNLNAF